MKWPVTLSLAAATVLVASCATSPAPVQVVGDFCDVADPMYYETTEVADFVVDNDPDLADNIAAHNIYGEQNCGWSFGSP